MVASLVFGTTLAHSLSAAMSASISATDRSSRSLRVSAWEWERMAPMRTQRPSMMIRLAVGGAEDLVGLGAGLPLFLGLAVAQVLVDPGDQGAGQRHAELGGVRCRSRCVARTLRSISRMADAGSSSAADLGVERAELGEQLAHVPGAAAGGRLVGHGGAPLDQAVLEQAAQAHQHAGDGAVAADEVLDAVEPGRRR